MNVKKYFIFISAPLKIWRPGQSSGLPAPLSGAGNSRSETSKFTLNAIHPKSYKEMKKYFKINLESTAEASFYSNVLFIL